MLNPVSRRLLVLVLCAWAAATPAAARAGAPGPLRVSAAGTQINAAAPVLASPTTPHPGLITYHGGPVLHVHTTHPVFWTPPGYSYPAGYESGITGYFHDVAAASGRTDNVYAVAAQYTDSTGPVGYSQHTAAPIIDTDPLPADGCSVGSACLTSTQVANELTRVLASHGLSQDSTDVYFLYTPPGLTTCNSIGPMNGCSDQNGGFCGYHGGDGFPSAPLIAAYVQYPSNPGCQTARPDPADWAINITSHEQIESLTDPLDTAWYGPSLEDEVADVCVGQFPGLIYTPKTGPYNQVINGHRYLLQGEFDDQVGECLSGAPSAATAAATKLRVGVQSVCDGVLSTWVTGAPGFRVRLSFWISARLARRLHLFGQPIGSEMSFGTMTVRTSTEPLLLTMEGWAPLIAAHAAVEVQAGAGAQHASARFTLGRTSPGCTSPPSR
jgi:hypothetical protein